ncbi:hypothetical protein RAS1_21120 [Phycisphaerae bacterium RAS1]|nr:hypothetical protein RAS1_21100 [Phycisphaerae bacterium RAS1]TWT45683.1 hypothetical protein RAS1_21120 [Phycisphaerae bacterium RAS1]
MIHRNQLVSYFELTNTYKEASSPPKPDPLSLNDMAASYRRAEAGAVKRDICLRAIDAGYLSTTQPVSVVRQLCGEDFDENAGVDDRGVAYGVVRFPDANRSEQQQVACYGTLRLVVKHDRGIIYDYHLTSGGVALSEHRRK